MSGQPRARERHSRKYVEGSKAMHATDSRQDILQSQLDGKLWLCQWGRANDIDDDCDDQDFYKAAIRKPQKVIYFIMLPSYYTLHFIYSEL